METLLPWLARFIHVSSIAIWVGGFAALAFVIIPVLRRGTNTELNSVAIGTVRILSFSSLVALISGVALIYLTRGFGSMLRGEWGGIVIGAIILAFALGFIGDAGLRPSLKKSVDDPTQLQRAQRLAVLGLGLSILSIALMTRAIYARS